MSCKHSKTLLWCGYLVLGWGLLGVAVDSGSRSRGLYVFNFGIILGLGAHMIIGVVAILCARCLMNIEGRLDRIEAPPET
jgi:hypothetical protein